MKSISRFYLFFIIFLTFAVNAQARDFGMSNEAGRYFNVGDANIYYEVYGNGPPLVLLHGGLYGYIDDYKDYIPTLSKSFKVIAIATRGHGKSGIGSKPISYQQLADDVMSILSHESQDKATIIGFSDGAITAYLLAAEYQNKIKKIVAIGGGLRLSNYNKETIVWLKTISPQNFNKNNAEFIKNRKKLMPQPERWDEFLEKMKAAWLEPVWIPFQKAKSIVCPVLIIGGDRDEEIPVDQFVEVYRTIPHSELAIVPNSGHVNTMTNSTVFKSIILPFVSK